jgi:hypothetical protein
MTAELSYEQEMGLIEITSTEVSDMLSMAKSLVVTNDDGYRGITRLYKEAKEWQKKVEAARKSLCAPFRSKIAEINDNAKKLTDPLDQVIELANAKTNSYQKILERAKEQEDEQTRAIAALFDAEDMVYIEPLAETIRGDGAIAVTKTEKRFKLSDLSKVPLKYLQLNEDIVKQDIKLGIGSIPGIDIYEETITKLRTR